MRPRLRPDEAGAARLVERIYERAEDTEGFENALHEFGDALGAEALCVHRYDLRKGRGEAVRILRGLTSQDADEYTQHHAAHNVWMERMPGAPRPGDVLVSHRVCPDRELVRHRFYREFLEPRGLFAMLAVVLESTDRQFETVNVLRGPLPGNYDHDEESLARRLVPHLRTLHRLQKLVAAERARRTLLAEVLDRIPTAVIALDRDLGVVEHNRAAEGLCAVGDGITITRGRLQVADCSARNALRSAIGRMAGNLPREGASACASFQVGRPSMRRPYAATLTPVRPVVPCDATQQACCLLFIDDLDEERLPAARRLVELWGLTPAEARVARLLASGCSPRDIAAELEVTFNTVRTHLQRVFLKTDTSRQGEIVRLVTRLGLATHTQCRPEPTHRPGDRPGPVPPHHGGPPNDRLLAGGDPGPAAG